MSRNRNEPIAIIGSGCRFPGGSSSVSKLWDLLESPRDVSREIGADRFNLDQFYHKDGSHHGTTNTREGYLLSEDIRGFDAKFFGIPPGEAEVIDPQQRLLLEVVYEAVESAGLTLTSLAGSDTAIYVGLMCQDYFMIQGQDFNSVPTYGATGTAASNASSRISYFFDWHGPSMTIDTACSSSMVCVNEAVQALRNGTSRVAVACGTSLMLSVFMYITLSKLKMLSPTGRCHMWDEKADGYARGEGVACVVLKTLSAAIQDGDNIACVIREIGLNHDGRTKGLTMPSAEAQASLIRETYARAGLDPTTKSGRCQFFEAHGTGTPAGDPKEAEALSTAFFPDPAAAEGELLVGSVKTVIGHTEGCAGIAGILKACLALQHSIIPPNLLFNRLNPDIKPFASHLRIPLACEPWPKLPEGTPRRASVNSFGFGGANAHCILESYTSASSVARPISNGSVTNGSITNGSITNGSINNAAHPPASCIIQFVFSAASEKSLIALLESTMEFLDKNPGVELSSLAYTLSTRRSPLSRRLAIYAASVEQLQEEIKVRLETAATDGASSLAVLALQAAPSIMGIFTGQGAQWPTMGSGLFASSPMARAILTDLDESLASLPMHHRPCWTLLEELSAHSTSGVSEAAMSQPLCTAVQIVLVDLLRAAGVRFRAVVGHSSGEIAAAYAAGFVRASDAIRIAYYRGYFAKLAAGPAGEEGGMIAVGTDFEDACELCQVDDFIGRLCVAAHNSPTSVTLSGDVDAITQALSVFEEEKKFVKALRVDTAYHSPHMLRCSSSYLKALQECRIQPLQPPQNAPQWFSSVYNARIMADTANLDGQYWVDNMVQPVLFYPTIQTCLTAEGMTINCALEVGPHPALRGPTKESILALNGQDIPYSGTLKRGSNDVQAFSDALGWVWSYFGPAGVDLGGFQQTYQPQPKVKAIFDLPSYPWTNDIIPWAEARSSKLFSTQPGRFHDLLGLKTADGLVEEWRWRNVLKLNELKWLSGHALQGQVVFPATGYIGLIMEAAMQIAQGRPVQSIDLFDMEIRKAIAIHESAGNELLVSMTKVSPLDADIDEITADFTVFSTTSKNSSQLALNCCGNVRISLGTDWSSRFSPRTPPVARMREVDVDRIYQVMKDDLGFGYEGPFRGLTSVSRRLGRSVATIRCYPFDEGDTPLLFHPGMLDSALQGLYTSYSAPGDGRLWSLVAPTSFRRITLIPDLCGENITDEVAIDCSMTDSINMIGDVDVYSANYQHKIIEIEGIKFSPLAPATSEDDSHLFQESFLCLDKPDASVVSRKQTPEEKRKTIDAERAAFYYLKNLHLSVGHEERGKLPWYRQAMIGNAERVYNNVKNGKHSYAPQSWINDTREEIFGMMESYGNQDADFNLTKAVGENILLPEVLSGETSILEHMKKNNYLERYYTDAIGFEVLNAMIAVVLGQLCNKFPHMNFLEVGAGTGGATEAILGRIGHAFSSYTYTDISSAFFEYATERFRSQAHKILFKTLDITEDPSRQGFSAHTYDIVIASNVLHATAPLKESLKHVRKLLKPGGYLVLLELIQNDVMRPDLIWGCLPGWWVGENDGRRWGPLLTLEEWDTILRETGFAGIETNSPMPDPEDGGSIIVAKAQNGQVGRLSNPLNSTPDVEQDCLLILGGQDAVVSGFCEQLTSILRPYFKKIVHSDHLSSLSDLTENVYVLSLTECDENLFEDMEESVFENLKRLLGSAVSVLWLLQGRRSDNPYAGVTLGLLRTIRYEYPGVLLQALNVEDDLGKVKASVVAESMLRLRELAELTRRGESDQVLCNFEPELVLEDGRLHALRVRQHESQNARYNSSRRSITSLVDSSQSIALGLVWAKHSYVLREQHEFERVYLDDHVTIRVSCSYLSSMKTPAGFAFICLGTDMNTGEKTICFASCNASIVRVHRSWALRVANPGFVDGHFMSFVVAELLAQQVLQMLPHMGTVVAFEPDPVVSALLAKRLAEKGQKFLVVTTRPEFKANDWLYLHPHCTQRAIDASLPADVTFFVDGLGAVSSSRSLGSRIAASLSPVCEKINFSSIIAREASILPEIAPESITGLLQRTASFASFSSQFGPVPVADGAPLNILPLTRVVSSIQAPSPISLVGWQLEAYVPVSVEPIFERQDLFRPDRTYWLAGLSGELGQSLADFMIGHNAKYVVLSSRTPQVDEGWVQWHKSRGASVAAFAGDITNFESVKQIYDDIKKSMPAIGGVANGAMVLRDSSFAGARFEDFQAVLRPKIQGTINLDRLFSKTSNEPLDWFIGFSSLAAMIGNPGQGAYSAGNGFIKDLVTRRRNQGLAGSVIHISRVAGLGYIERELSKDLQHRLKMRSGTLAMSDVDLHQLFAEAIVAGRPRSGLNPEIITGLEYVTTEQAKEIYWKSNAKMGLLIREVGHGIASEDKRTSIPVKDLLEAAKTMQEAKAVIVASLKAKLQAAKFLADSDGLQDTTPLVDLGIDSLIAVEMRAWFVKEVEVDVPVMKILGGASMAELVDFVLENLPEILLSRLDNGADQTKGAVSVVNDTQEKAASTEENLANHDAEYRPNGQVD